MPYDPDRALHEAEHEIEACGGAQPRWDAVWKQAIAAEPLVTPDRKQLYQAGVLTMIAINRESNQISVEERLLHDVLRIGFVTDDLKRHSAVSVAITHFSTTCGRAPCQRLRCAMHVLFIAMGYHIRLAGRLPLLAFAAVFAGSMPVRGQNPKPQPIALESPRDTRSSNDRLERPEESSFAATRIRLRVKLTCGLQALL